MLHRYDAKNRPPLPLARNEAVLHANLWLLNKLADVLQLWRTKYTATNNLPDL